VKSLGTYFNTPGPCEYLPSEEWLLEYEEFEELRIEEYHKRLLSGWRRFGHYLFRPQCARCSACQSLRIKVREFAPTISQRRVIKSNKDILRVAIRPPSVNQEKLDLSLRFHQFQEEHKGWPSHEHANAMKYFLNFVHNPFHTEEWQYFRDDVLVGVGYVDALPDGLSAIYFYYEPSERRLSLGTWNVLSLIEEARSRSLPYVYLGYFVPASRSMEYKARFRPHELLRNGSWCAVE